MESLQNIDAISRHNLDSVESRELYHGDPQTFMCSVWGKGTGGPKGHITWIASKENMLLGLGKELTPRYQTEALEDWGSIAWTTIDLYIFDFGLMFDTNQTRPDW